MEAVEKSNGCGKSKSPKIVRGSIFRRGSFVLRGADVVEAPPAPDTPAPSSAGCEWTVMVINASYGMAKEITLQLSLTLAGASIIYAPTIALARWVLRSRSIDLVISSPLLPDGGVDQLQRDLERMDSPPDVVVVGDVNLRAAHMFRDSAYEIAAFRRLGRAAPAAGDKPQESVPAAGAVNVKQSISALGADLRNDLNNPLQEIVAMVFVAQASDSEGGPATAQALDAIDSAAKNMAKVVSNLEARIRDAVQTP